MNLIHYLLSTLGYSPYSSACWLSTLGCKEIPVVHMIQCKAEVINAGESNNPTVNNLRSKNDSPKLAPSCWDLFLYMLKNNHDKNTNLSTDDLPELRACLQGFILPSSLAEHPPPPWPYLRAAQLKKTFLLCSGDVRLWPTSIMTCSQFLLKVNADFLLQSRR